MLNQEESRFFFCPFSAKNLISPHKLAPSSLHLGNRGDQEKMESSSAVIVVFFVFYVFLSVPKDVFFLTMFLILMQKYSLLLFNETAFFGSEMFLEMAFIAVMRRESHQREN